MVTKGSAYSQKWRDKHPNYVKLWNRKNPDKVKNSKIKTRYGITFDQYKQMLISQSYKCAICGNEIRSEKEWCLDHDHNSKKVRAFLCRYCNWGVGCFKDNSFLCRIAAEYLDKWKTC